jgi:hypothetical protein
MRPVSRLATVASFAALTADLPLELPETPPDPLSTMPFRHDADYIQRSSLIEEINLKLSRPAARVALVGLGGVG